MIAAVAAVAERAAAVGQAAGQTLPRFGWHTFRRQNITLIQEEGATPFEAQAQAGHSKPMMTSAYTLVGLDRRKKAVRKGQLRLLKKTLSGSNAGIVRDFEVVGMTRKSVSD